MHHWYSACILVFTLLGTTVAGAAEPPLSDTYSLEIKELGDLLKTSGYAEVLEKGEELLVLVRADFPDGSFDEAKILDFMVNACYRSGRVMDPEALVMANRAVAMKEELLGPDDPELANSLMHQGNLYTCRWESEEAIPRYRRAVVILETAGPGYDDQRAIILSSEGVANRRLGRNLEALILYDQALAIQVRVLGPDHPNVASTLNNQASVLSNRGDYSSAAALHRRALAIRENSLGPDHEWVGESANNLANQLAYLGINDEALAVQERAIQIFKDRLGPTHQRYWLAMQNLGLIYLDMGDPAGALPICQDALVGLNDRYGEGHVETTYALDALASCYHGLERYEEALEYLAASVRIIEEAYGPGNLATADAITLQGKCLTALGRLDEAFERLNHCLEIRLASIEEDNALLCDNLNQLAELDLRMENPGLALDHARRSSAICRQDLGENHPLLAASSLLEGRAELALGDADAALELALLAEEISRQHLQQTMLVLSEDRALAYAGSRVEGLDLALSILADGESGPRVARVWDSVIHSRSAVLDEYAARNRYLSDGDDPMTAALLDSSLVLRERLANLTLRGPGWEDVPVYHQLLADTEVELDAIDRQLSLRSAGFRQWEAGHHDGFPEAAAALPAGSTLAGYVSCADEAGRKSYKVFILDEPDGMPRISNLGDAPLVDAAVTAWRDQATLGVKRVAPQSTGQPSDLASRGFVAVSADGGNRLDAYAKTGKELRRLVWDPVAADLDRDGTIFVVADGSLNLVSFPSLPTDDDRYLVEMGHLLHLLTSEKALRSGQKVPTDTGRLLALGGADFHAVGGSPPDGLTFRPLPSTLTEVERIGAIWTDQGGSIAMLMGADATKEHLKQNLPDTEVLHLATHGFFLPKSTGSDGGIHWDNPLIRSGLALAGANDWQPDGILTAEEVAALDLSGLQWAVLSACDTGLGDLDARGEGVFGLRRVFALAGARTVIMSLWSVDDASSCDWMAALYRAHWEDGLSTAAAVRRASLDVLAARRAAGLSEHPYYWAGFVAEAHGAPVDGPDPHEESLARGLAAGSLPHIEDFLHRTHRPVYAMTARLTSDPDLRHDWCQDILLKIITEMAADRFVYQRPGCFWAWFKLRTRFLLINKYQQHKKQESRWTSGDVGQDLMDRMPLTSGADPLALLEAVESRRVIEECLDELPSEDQRRALYLLLFQEQSYQEVAETMGATLNTIRSWIRRARITMRRCVAAKLEYRP